MSRLGSLYITSGEPEGPLCGGCCEVDDWAAEEIERLRAALRQVAQSHAWLAFGECRSFGVYTSLLTPSEADAVARAFLPDNEEMTGAVRVDCPVIGL